MGIARFMSSFEGRLLRIVVGIALIVIGLAVVHGTGGIILAIIGLIPLVAGIGNFSVFAPLFGGRSSAKDLQLKPVPIKVVHSEHPHRRYH